MSTIETRHSGRVNIGQARQVPPGEGRIVRLGGRRIAVFRTRGGEVFATAAGCSHRNGPLADGIVTNRTVTCPLHGCSFDLTTGQAGGGCAAVRTFPVSFSETGDILIGTG